MERGESMTLGYNEHMKRTNLVLDEQLLQEAVRVSGERTYSATVNLALAELVRRAKAGRILELAGSGLWEGDLAEMRADGPTDRLGSE
jgi:Arc/MetJ family transcription regulator